MSRHGLADRVRPHDLPPRPHRRPDPAPARRLRRPAACGRRAPRRLGVDVAFNWDHFFPLYGDPDGQALRVLDDARRLGRADRPHRDRRPRHVQQLPQPGPAGRHGPHRRPHQRRPADPRHRLGLVREGLRRSTATSSAPPAAASTRSARRCPASRPGWPAGNPAPTRKMPELIGGGGERKTLRWSPATPTSGTASATSTSIDPQARRPRRLVRQGGPRPRRDRALGRASDEAARRRSASASTTSAAVSSPSASTAPPTTSAPSTTGSPGATTRTRASEPAQLRQLSYQNVTFSSFWYRSWQDREVRAERATSAVTASAAVRSRAWMVRSRRSAEGRAAPASAETRRASGVFGANEATTRGSRRRRSR